MEKTKSSQEAFKEVQNFLKNTSSGQVHNGEMEVKFTKIHPNAVTPEYAHDGDVGMDLYAVSYEWDEENDFYVYHTGIKMEALNRVGGFLFPRSSNRKTNCYLANSVGIADIMIYRGEIMLCFKDRTSSEDRIRHAGYEAFFETMSYSTLEKALVEKKNAEEKMKERINNLEFAPYRDLSKAVGQIVILNFDKVRFNEVDKLSDSERGENGFGSTDKKNK